MWIRLYTTYTCCVFTFIFTVFRLNLLLKIRKIGSSFHPLVIIMKKKLPFLFTYWLAIWKCITITAQTRSYITFFRRFFLVSYNFNSNVQASQRVLFHFCSSLLCSCTALQPGWLAVVYWMPDTISAKVFLPMKIFKKLQKRCVDLSVQGPTPQCKHTVWLLLPSSHPLQMNVFPNKINSSRHSQVGGGQR